MLEDPANVHSGQRQSSGAMLIFWPMMMTSSGVDSTHTLTVSRDELLCLCITFL